MLVRLKARNSKDFERFGRFKLSNINEELGGQAIRQQTKSKKPDMSYCDRVKGAITLEFQLKLSEHRIWKSISQWQSSNATTSKLRKFHKNTQVYGGLEDLQAVDS